jgi:TolB-like protein
MALAGRIRAGDGFPGSAGIALPRKVDPGPFETVLPPAMVEAVATSPAVAPSGAAKAARSRHPLVARFAWAAVVAGLILLFAGAFALWPSSRLAPAIAVARFHNVTGTAAQDVANAGLADLVKLRLATEQHLRLADDTEAGTDNASVADLVRRSTQPRYRLEGTVAFDTSAMHVTARLADLSNGTELSSDRYDRPTGDATQSRGEHAPAVRNADWFTEAARAWQWGAESFALPYDCERAAAQAENVASTAWSDALTVGSVT